MSETVIVAVIIGLSEIFKKVGINAKFIPIINLVLGIALCSAYSTYLSGDMRLDIFQGIIIGLTASGLYSGGKNILEGITE